VGGGFFFQGLTLEPLDGRNGQERFNIMARTRTKPLELNEKTFLKLLSQKREIEKQIEKQNKKLKAVKDDLGKFKVYIADLSK
jgi:nitrogen regulatory protein PII